MTLARWDFLKLRASRSPHGEKQRRERELRDATRRLLGFPRALKRVQRKRSSPQGGCHGR